MFARKYLLQKWEIENQRQLLFLARQTQNLLKLSLLRAAKITSFLLYLGYGGGKCMLMVARGLFVGPKLIQWVSPDQYLEKDEFERRDLNSCPQLWLK